MRKRIATAAICLILGAIINCTVAWTRAYEPLTVREQQAINELLNVTMESPVLARVPPAERQSPLHVKQGWPVNALQYEKDYPIEVLMPGQSVPAPTLDRGIVIPEFKGILKPLSFTRLALRPLFPGFLINTFIYGSLAYLILLALSTLRRTRRQHRHHCPNCNYNLSAADHTRCPECGAAVRANALPL